MKRVAIVGTAQTWKLTPFDDGALEIWSLNDAYRMKGFQRATRWYDFHPLDHFYFPKGDVVHPAEVPPGHYVRPAGHLDWLGNALIPVYLHPEFVTQYPAAAAWSHARPFPKVEIEEYFGRYMTSSPAWMLAHAVMEGYRDIQIYGIHLATEQEYIEQRPNFEFLLGRVLGPSKAAVTTVKGIRSYETPDGRVSLPEASPVLQSPFQYAFQPRPRAKEEPLKWEVHKLTVKRERAVVALKNRPWWKPAGPLTSTLQYAEAALEDAREALGRLQMAAGG